MEESIKSKVESGRYHSAGQVMQAALRALDDQEHFRKERLEDLKREIAIGLKDLDEGRKEPLDEKLLEEIKAGGRALLEAYNQRSDRNNAH